MAIAMAFDPEAAGILIVAIARQADPLLTLCQKAQQGAHVIKRCAAIGADGAGANRGIRHAAPRFRAKFTAKTVPAGQA